MKKISFLDGVGIALLVSLIGSILFYVLGGVLALGGVLRLVIALSAFIYLLYLLRRSNERVGRVTVLVFWSVATVSSWFMGLPILFYVLVHLVMLWLVRSLYFYSSILSAIADLGLGGLGLLAAIGTAYQTQNIFISLWCFFLIQALFVYIPKTLGKGDNKSRPIKHGMSRFDQAHRDAESAIRRLSSI